MTNHKEHYDIVLKGGRVIDPETYLDGQMHVGIKGDRIAAAVHDKDCRLTVNGLTDSPAATAEQTQVVVAVHERVGSFQRQIPIFRRNR